MPGKEGYQLPLEFRNRNSWLSQVTYEIGFLGAGDLEGSGRFVRKVQEEVSIRSPADAAYHLIANVFTPFEAFDQEEAWGLLLNAKNQVTHETMIYRGTINTIYIRQAELFKEAVRVNAAALILAHVHPSGSPEPSPVIWRKCQVS